MRIIELTMNCVDDSWVGINLDNIKYVRGRKTGTRIFFNDKTFIDVTDDYRTVIGRLLRNE